MDSRVLMLLVCLGTGIGISAMASFLMPSVVILGAIVAAIPGIMLYTTMKRSGLDALMRRPVKGEVLVLYISGTRRVFPLIGRELMERYIKLPGYGRVRVTRGSDYMFLGWKTVMALAGAAHTISAEKVRQAMELKKVGLTNLAELEAMVKVAKGEGFLAHIKNEEEVPSGEKQTE